MASFDEIQLPTSLAYGAKGGPGFSTDVIALSSGYEQRNANWSLARLKWDVSTALKTNTDFATLLAFFYARQGRARGFRFKDWQDFSAFGMACVGATDGVNHAFQLQKTYKSGGQTYTRTILKPVNNGTWEVPVPHADGTIPVTPVTIYVNAVKIASSGFTVDYTTGIVTITAAPTQPVTADFEFDVPARFDIDMMENVIQEFNTNVWQAIPVIEIRV